MEREGSIPAERACSLLTERRRRELIGALMERRGRAVSIEECAVSVWKRLEDDPPDRENIRTAVCHVDVPKLADAGVVAYDRPAGTVRYRSDDRLEAVFEAVESEQLE